MNCALLNIDVYKRQAVMAYASHLGGKMVYEHRVGVDRTDGQVFPDEFVAILPESTLADGKPCLLYTSRCV